MGDSDSKNDSSGGSTPATTQATRSRAGCLTCRARKLRCDRNGPDATGSSCGRCARLGVKCVSSNNASLSQKERRQLQGDAARRHDLNQAGFTRLRTAASCRYCRSRRQKCSGDRPACARCQQSKQECIYDRGKTEVKTSESMSPTNIAVTASATSAVMTLQAEGSPLSTLRNFHDKALIRSLVEVFFHEISPLRCFGFIHEPSFMLRMDYLLSNDDKDPLLMTVCALASRATNQPPEIRAQGAAWAQCALVMTRSQAHRISVNNLMCLVLLHEYFARVDEVSQCFILGSLACRLAQALQLNVEYDEDYECRSSALSATEKETRRRLMWACYILDFACSGGLDPIKMFEEEDVSIQMPADEQGFFYRTAGMTSFLKPIGQLAHQDHLGLGVITSNGPLLGGYRAYYIHLLVIRERTIRYLKRRVQEEDPSGPMSQYNLLLSDLEQWRASLPQNLRLTPEIIYIRKSQGELSALFDIHTGYHQCGCDLYRAMIPELQLPPKRHNNMTMTATPEFLAEGKRRWFRHACEMTKVFRLAIEHAPKSMTEPGSSIHAYTAIRTKLYYQLYIMTNKERQTQSAAVEESIQTDLEYLRLMTELHPSAGMTLACSEELVRTLDPRSGGTNPAEEGPSTVDTPVNTASPHHSAGTRSDAGGSAVVVDLAPTSNPSPAVNLNGSQPYSDTSGRPHTAPQVSVDVILHPLAPFRVLRAKLSEKHTPEKMRGSTLSLNGDEAVSPGLNIAAPFLTAPAELPQQQFSNAFWGLDENSFAWINADVQDTDFMMSNGWYA
ncbi:uncharacterized protein E0L32_003429 [Thyridium curvatum]|uniref:Zn(2)-C6 fungal-type domain-containing protein n=1 Tax=Thyridium curvatum TaxID=1093900 RepID=A0A507BAH3_9PEZI|nr:uncharacterized protein E0L32_003429 [Thyridium curvatum]TPX16867.1 hypothetical protein E0L32_003429 [Thyridium curvatum]